MLKKKIFILLVMAGVAGCTSELSPSKAEEGVVYGGGVVSEDPPGAGDWEGSDTASDADDTAADDTAASDEEMAESYEGCSNEIYMWVEPDPLTRPCNFQLVDQNENYVELYDFEGDVILLDFSTVWCSVCKRVAEHVQSLHDQYDPFSVITVLTEDSSGNSPDVNVLQAWANAYGITTSPVLAGDDTMAGTDPDQWNIVAVPTFFLIDKEFYVRVLQPGWNEETVTTYIENLITE